MEFKELVKFETNLFGSGDCGTSFKSLINSSDDVEVVYPVVMVLTLDTIEVDLRGTRSGDANDWEV